MDQPKLYAEYNAMPRKEVKEILDNYLKLVKWHENATILDVGCGPGDITAELLLPRLPKNFKSLTGVDISHEMISHAKECQRSDERVDYQYLDIGSKEIPDNFCGKFDHIFSFFCFHWIQNQRQVMENLFKMLKPGGEILISYLSMTPVFEGIVLLAKEPKWRDYMKDCERYEKPFRDSSTPEKDLEKVLEQVGFQTQICKNLERSYQYTDRNIFRNTMIAVNGVYSSIPKELRDEFMDDYIAKMKETSNLVLVIDSKGTFMRMNYNLFLVLAAKKDG